MQILNTNIEVILQIILAFGLINVWLVRFRKPTQYRGGNSKNMFQEFAAYGLPKFMVYVVGGLKLVIAFAFLLGLVVPISTMPFVYLLAFLMVGAVAMHMKIQDGFRKTLPALLMLAMCLVLIF